LLIGQIEIALKLTLTGLLGIASGVFSTDMPKNNAKGAPLRRPLD
jgi:hypothetical protein